jgi:dihydrodipicolinate synthase/N-acetylneuraminate lyase
VQKVKYSYELMGIPLGEPCRPLLPLSDAEKRKLARTIAAADDA